MTTATRRGKEVIIVGSVSDIKKTEKGEYGNTLDGVVCLKFQIYFIITLNPTSHSVKVVHLSRPNEIAHCSRNFETTRPNYPI
jgi:hypothetical protein